MIVVALLTSDYKYKRDITILVFLFLIIYILKVIYTESTFPDAHQLPLSRRWEEYILYFVAYNILPFLAYKKIDFKTHFKTILNAFIFSGFVLSVVSLYLYGDIIKSGIGRISMVKYENPELETLSPLSLSYGGTLTIALCLMKILFFYKKNRLELLYLLTTIILSFVIFYLGATRGSLVALGLSLLTLLVYLKGKNKIYLSVLIVVFIPLFQYGAELSGSDIFNRATSTFVSGDTSEREPLLLGAINEFQLNPFFGGRIEVSGIYPHNILLETLMATGMLGFVILIVVVISYLIKTNKLIKGNNIYILSMLIFLNGISQYMVSGAIYFAILLFIPLGISWSTTHES